jgi:adenine-specific DNA-methyltransferase
MIGPYTQEGTSDIKNLFDINVFGFTKPVSLLKYLLSFSINESDENSDIILDFFSGSATTAHATMQLNAEDGGNRKYIMVQLPEITDQNSEAYKAGYKNICEIGKERIRRAAKKIKEEKTEAAKRDGMFADFTDTQDYGFRVYRLDSSNMQDVYYRPQDYQQDQLAIFEDNIKPDRKADDLLAQVMLDWGLPLSLKIEQISVQGKQVYKVEENFLFACFDSGVDEAFAKEIAAYKPLRIVFRDSSFTDNSAKENVRQLLKQLSPDTEMKVI